MEKSLILYEDIYSEIKEALLTSRNQAYNAVNFAMVQAYWQIGRIIVNYEQKGNFRAEYGKSLLQELSIKLTEDFGKGFSVRTLQQMKKFYSVFPNANALCSHLSWSHYRLLISIENNAAREWYMHEAEACAWSSRQLDRQISTLYYERLLASQSKDLVKAEATELLQTIHKDEFIKDPYVLEFLDLNSYPALRESELEQALIDKLQEFLNEAIARYSVLNDAKQVFASKYQLALPTLEELQREIETARKRIEDQ